MGNVIMNSVQYTHQLEKNTFGDFAIDVLQTILVLIVSL